MTVMKILMRWVGAWFAGMAVAGAWLWLSGLWNECSFAPKIVTYQPGMTVCPGQTVTFPPVIIPLPWPREPGPAAAPERPV